MNGMELGTFMGFGWNGMREKPKMPAKSSAKANCIVLGTRLTTLRNAFS